MAVNVDIFNPQETRLATGLATHTALIFGSNRVGKTAQAVRFPKPFVIATESGLNATVGVKYNRVNSWADFMKIVKQFTSKQSVDRAKEMYQTIIIDELYALALLCQDYVQQVIGEGALTLSDAADPRKNLYSAYEKIFFKAINTLLSCDYTVIFIGHEQIDKDGKAWPKGDKRSIDPVKDFVDYIVYIKSNGVDENGNVIPSSAYMAETDKWFAGSRFPMTKTYLPEWSAEAFEEAIDDGIKQLEKKTGVKAVSYQEQQAMNTTVEKDFDKVMAEMQEVGQKLMEAGYTDVLVETVESTLGPGRKVSDCTKKQIDAVLIILDDLKSKIEELGI